MNSENTIERLDVVIVGAGISGIAAAAELQRACPDKSYAMLEMRAELGGTWDLFRYPGVRSDSDMFTLGFSFKPWTAPESIATGESILEYLQETVAEFGLGPRIRYNTRLAAASWSSETNEWTLSLETPDGGRTIVCGFLFMASGYYSYQGGFNPTLPGEDLFEGVVIHPQEWPEDLDYSGRRVAVIGSGATAITLIPSMAGRADKVTMIQRSPGYMAVESDVDAEAHRLREQVGPQEAFSAMRLRNLRDQQRTYQQARTDPETYKQSLFAVIDAIVGAEYRQRHFTPSYQPWDQRVCFVPNGDLFHAIREGKADVATGAIETLTPNGVRMADGSEVQADIIVKATGLDLAVAGEADFTVDGSRVHFGETFTYKGIAYSGVPNLVFAFGFLNSSWTLRIELLTRFWTSVLRRMDDLGASRVTPTLRPGDAEMERIPFLTPVTSGYLHRAFPKLPNQGDRTPWVNPQDYEVTQELLTADPQDGVLLFEKWPPREPTKNTIV